MNKKPAKHDDMRIPKNKQQYTNVANRDLLRSFTGTDKEQKPSDNSKKKEGE